MDSLCFSNIVDRQDNIHHKLPMFIWDSAGWASVLVVALDGLDGLLRSWLRLGRFGVVLHRGLPPPARGQHRGSEQSCWGCREVLGQLNYFTEE